MEKGDVIDISDSSSEYSDYSPSEDESGSEEEVKCTKVLRRKPAPPSEQVFKDVVKFLEVNKNSRGYFNCPVCLFEDEQRISFISLEGARQHLTSRHKLNSILRAIDGLKFMVNNATNPMTKSLPATNLKTISKPTENHTPSIISKLATNITFATSPTPTKSPAPPCLALVTGPAPAISPAPTTSPKPVTSAASTISPAPATSPKRASIPIPSKSTIPATSHTPAKSLTPVTSPKALIKPKNSRTSTIVTKRIHAKIPLKSFFKSAPKLAQKLKSKPSLPVSRRFSFARIIRIANARKPILPQKVKVEPTPQIEAPKLKEEPQPPPKIDPFVLYPNNSTSKENSKRLGSFVKQCLAITNTKEKLAEYRTNGRDFNCPFCLGKKYKLVDNFTFMRHLIRNHEACELVPLPYILRPEEKTKKRPTSLKIEGFDLAEESIKNLFEPGTEQDSDSDSIFSCPILSPIGEIVEDEERSCPVLYPEIEIPDLGKSSPFESKLIHENLKLREETKSMEFLKSVKDIPQLVSPSISLQEIDIVETNYMDEVSILVEDMLEFLENGSGNYQATKSPNKLPERIQEAQTSTEIIQEAQTSLEISEEASTSHEIIIEASNSAELSQEASTSSEIIHEASTSSEIIHEASTSSEIIQEASTSFEIIQEASTSSEIIIEVPTLPEFVLQALSLPEIIEKPSTFLEIIEEVPTSPKLITEILSSAETIPEAQSLPETIQEVSTQPEIIQESSSIIEKAPTSPEIIPNFKNSSEIIHEALTLSGIIQEASTSFEIISESPSPEIILIASTSPEKAQFSYQQSTAEVSNLTEDLNSIEEISKPIIAIVDVIEPNCLEEASILVEDMLGFLERKLDSNSKKVPPSSNNLPEIDQKAPEFIDEISKLTEASKSIEKILETIAEIEEVVEETYLEEASTLVKDMLELLEVDCSANEKVIKSPNKLQEIIHEAPNPLKIIQEPQTLPEISKEALTSPEILTKAVASTKITQKVPNSPKTIQGVSISPQIIVEVSKLPEIITENPTSVELNQESLISPEISGEGLTLYEVIQQAFRSTEIIEEVPASTEILEEIIEKDDESCKSSIADVPKLIQVSKSNLEIKNPTPEIENAVQTNYLEEEIEVEKTNNLEEASILVQDMLELLEVDSGNGQVPKLPNTLPEMIEDAQTSGIIEQAPTLFEIIEEALESTEIIIEAPVSPEIFLEVSISPEKIEKAPNSLEIAQAAITSNEIIMEAPILPEIILETTISPEITNETLILPEVSKEAPNSPKIIEEAPNSPKIIEEVSKPSEIIKEATESIAKVPKLTQIPNTISSAPKSIEVPNSLFTPSNFTLEAAKSIEVTNSMFETSQSVEGVQTGIDENYESYDDDGDDEDDGEGDDADDEDDVTLIKEIRGRSVIKPIEHPDLEPGGFMEISVHKFRVIYCSFCHSRQASIGALGTHLLQIHNIDVKKGPPTILPTTPRDDELRKESLLKMLKELEEKVNEMNKAIEEENEERDSCGESNFSPDFSSSSSEEENEDADDLYVPEVKGRQRKTPRPPPKAQKEPKECTNLRRFLEGFQQADGSFPCPHCLEQGESKIYSTLWNVTRHVKTIHNDNKIKKDWLKQNLKRGRPVIPPKSGPIPKLIPMPKQIRVKKPEAEASSSSSRAQAQTQIKDPQAQGPSPYVICGNGKMDNAKSLSTFVKKCLAIPGTREGLFQFRNSSDSFYNCPNCPQGKFKIKDSWTLMRHLILTHPNSDLIPIPFVDKRQAKSAPVFNSNLPFKCTKCPKSYNFVKSLRSHLKSCKGSKAEENYENPIDLLAQESSDEELNPNDEVPAPSSDFNPNLSSKSPFLITGKTYEDRQKSMRIFSALCLQVPGARTLLKKHQTKNRTFICPLCVPKRILNSPKISNFLQHILVAHEYNSSFVPLPYIRIRKNKPALQTEQTIEKEKVKAISKFPNLSSNPEEVFVISGETSAQRHKCINNFTSLCFKAPGAREALIRHRNPNGNFTCPHCPSGKHLVLVRGWNFMRHLISAHKSSNLIPLPFIRPEIVVSNKTPKDKESEDEGEELDPNEDYGVQLPKSKTEAKKRGRPQKRKSGTLSEESDEEIVKTSSPSKYDGEEMTKTSSPTKDEDDDEEMTKASKEESDQGRNAKNETEQGAVPRSLSMEDAINELVLGSHLN